MNPPIERLFKMKICISNIKINSISNIGSLNIGKTILTRNENNTITQPEKEAQETNGPTDIQVPDPGQVQAPSPGQNVAPAPGDISVSPRSI
jgi:hypothetical protein